MTITNTNKMTPKEYRRKLEGIAIRYKEIETIYNTIPEGLRNEMLEFHNAEGSLQHSIRWGQQASEELIEAYEETHAKASENYDI